MNSGKNYYILYIIIPLLLITQGCGNKETSLKPEWVREPDPVTGREVWQISSHDSASKACYFENQAFTADDRYVVFASVRTGSWQLYRSDLETGVVKQLTDVTGLDSRYTIHPDGKRVSYMAGHLLLATDVATVKTDTIMEFDLSGYPNPVFSKSYTSDGRYTLLSTYGDGVISIYRINLESKEIELARSWEGEMVSHVQINPVYPHLITYIPKPDTQNDMTLPMDQRARTWIINMKTGEAAPFLIAPYGFRATHDSWSQDGEKFFFFKKSRPGWAPVSIASIDKDGSNWTEYYTSDTIKLGHGRTSSDNRWFISDGQDPGSNPLVLLNLETGSTEFLCWSNASIDGGHMNHAHVHPSFSSSGNYVIYTSDKTGTPQVYVVPLNN